jgi:hypothetical protein
MGRILVEGRGNPGWPEPFSYPSLLPQDSCGWSTGAPLAQGLATLLGDVIYRMRSMENEISSFRGSIEQMKLSLADMRKNSPGGTAAHSVDNLTGRPRGRDTVRYRSAVAVRRFTPSGGYG